MIYRYPDDPLRISTDKLKRLEDEDPPGTWLAQVKYDDWRKPSYLVNGKWTFYTKKGESLKDPPPDLVRELGSMGLPDNTALDIGWVGPRDVFKTLGGMNFLAVWDLLWWQNEWMGERPYKERLYKLGEILKACRGKAKASTERVRLAETRDKDFYKFFEEQKQNPLSEGIVLKEANSTLVGGFNKQKDNPAWYKVKYRDIKEATV